MSPFIQNSKGKTSLQLAITVTAASCPLTICLNILVIVAIMKIRKLQTNSNILIASLAMVDLLVGAVSMPMAISVDALIVRGTLSERLLCANIYILYTTAAASFNHLILIAWERYVAIARWTEYKLIVTKERVKRYAGIAWITAILTVAFYVTFTASDTQQVVLLAIKVSGFLVWLVGITLMAYFYRMVYIETQKLKGSQIGRDNAQVKARIESKINDNVLFVTIAVLVFSVPLVTVLMIAHFFPILHSFSVFRWAEIFLQFNALVNPAIYFYRNNRYRKAALTFLTFRRPKKVGVKIVTKCRANVVRASRTRRCHVGKLLEDEPSRVSSRLQSFTKDAHRAGWKTWGGVSANTPKRRYDFILFWHVGKLVDDERSRPFRRSYSVTEETHGDRKTWGGVSVGTPMKKRSSSLLTNRDTLRK
ncbi:trace amine-associated receptor 8c-like [Stylophora pistillata]|uniref:trace amine-associated receptor 8c-like n=1 Tax=Stylophora pistillata TaxID=50429 RepID=UPI000C03AD41|nr:trace amine-associated receptor 8c-like [Stylophora pistillata]